MAVTMTLGSRSAKLLFVLAATTSARTLIAAEPTKPEASEKRDASKDAPAKPEKAKDPADTKPPRAPLAPEVKREPAPEWHRYAEIGGDIALVTRTVSHDGANQPTGVRLRPAVGFGVHGRIPMHRYLGFTGYYVDSFHSLLVPPGGLGLNGLVDAPKVRIYEIGARLMPTLPIRDRARVWLSGGVGWGRLEYPAFNLVQGIQTASLRPRADSFAEIPFGFGASADIIKRWLTIEVEGIFAVSTGQGGSASGSAQAIDNQGQITHIGPLPRLDMTFVQTLGLSLVL